MSFVMPQSISVKEHEKKMQERFEPVIGFECPVRVLIHCGLTRTVQIEIEPSSEANAIRSRSSLANLITVTVWH